MGLLERIFGQARKPTGLLGRFIGMVMNKGHGWLQRDAAIFETPERNWITALAKKG